MNCIVPPRLLQAAGTLVDSMIAANPYKKEYDRLAGLQKNILIGLAVLDKAKKTKHKEYEYIKGKHYELSLEESIKESEQKQIKRKQELTSKYGATTAEKIIAGKLEIGMSKEVCKEVLKSNGEYPTVFEKTATTKTWIVTHFIFDYNEYLYFIDNKLVRIVTP